MSMIKDVLILNAHTIQLNQDAKKGDTIDLNLIEHIDSSLLTQKIDEQVNLKFNHMLNKEKEQWQIEHENQLQKALKDKDSKIIQLQEQLKLNENNIKTQIESTYQLKVERLNHQIDSLEQEKQLLLSHKQTEIDLEVSKTEKQLNDKIQSLISSLDQLKRDRDALIENLTLKLESAVTKKEQELSSIIHEKEQEISKLTLEKSSSNIKKMGEALESWVDQEYQNHAMNGFDTCIWEKDNQSIKLEGESRGTKADYIFKVYANESFDVEYLLTSVCVEIKSEDPQSVYKKKNADHYDKLDKDRRKKDCEYALLVSELEWETPNDAPVRKVQGYDKMYMVRPQYFIVFLNLISAISLQYKTLVSDYNMERIKFKDAEDIQLQFNDMKDEILERSLKYISNKMEEIEKSAEKIQEEATKIRKASRIVLDSHLQTIINKIENFKIERIIDQIQSLE